MSLHTLANHMSAHGRGPDSTLVHMSPREIQGLQSLAQAHGRSLTMNPQTGLPEAGILEDILPSIAGFAMDAFAPGSGAIASGIASLMGGESSSEPARSNPMGLASTSLERGLQAGFGTDIYESGDKQMSEKESPAGSFGAIQSAINTAPPKDYLQENKYNMYSAPQRYDSGGMTIGNVGPPVDASGKPIVIDPYDTRTDSQKAQDYLLGKTGAVNPFLFYHGAIPKATESPAALSTADISALAPDTGEAWSNRGGRGIGFEAQQIKDDQDAWKNLPDDQKSEYFADNPGKLKFHEFVLNALPLQTEAWKREKNIIEKAKLIPAQRTAASQAIANPVAEPSSPLMKQYAEQYGMYKNPNAVASPDPYTDPRTGDYKNPMSQGLPDADGGGRGDGNDAGGGSRDAGPATGNRGYGSQGQHAAYGGLLDSRYAHGGGIAALAQGGYNLGSYSDGGRLLRGPGDGVSDDIPATIGQNQPARLADGEFVIPARIVSELGNGSTDAGARKLYAMMDRVQKARSKTVGKDKVAANSRADKYLPS